MSEIFKDLCFLNLTSEESAEKFRKGTRDFDDLVVFKDKYSGVIFLKDFYTGDTTYIEGKYRKDEILKANSRHYLRRLNYRCFDDCRRRIKSFERFYINKDILDFGCGYGDFLLEASKHTKSSRGIELQEELISELKSQKIDCYKSIDEIPDESLDSIFLFHVFEHLPNPRKILTKLKGKLRLGGHLILEVPHAMDFLVSILNEESFLKWYFWSQHLILHTSQSLRIFLEDASFSEIIVRGIQRFPISNHFFWLKDCKPGGHESSLAFLETEQLNLSYESALSSIGATDTLISVAKKI